MCPLASTVYATYQFPPLWTLVLVAFLPLSGTLFTATIAAGSFLFLLFPFFHFGFGFLAIIFYFIT